MSEGTKRGTQTDISGAPITVWGESFDDLATAVLADKDAPPALLMAAFLYRHGEESELRSLIAEAVALNESESA